ncbi:MAG: hypothetical protein EZS28_004477 [Streblomastix strix]|uniref:Uncharacterized protein n=1 Tax=Streblomastix strix TaxID=222440 RepID=A0A5J4WYL7_9EUKA|nr:MAG: hypothetical protein EZS28_004477 [Streblomastix strix]
MIIATITSRIKEPQIIPIIAYLFQYHFLVEQDEGFGRVIFPVTVSSSLRCISQYTLPFKISEVLPLNIAVIKPLILSLVHSSGGLEKFKKASYPTV